MSKKKKALERLERNPKDLTFKEVENLLKGLGFKMSNKGKTSGSRVMFTKGKIIITLHKPHPGNELREYQIRYLVDSLKEHGLIG
jgi:predicted RNA binding protein YcfA (HicA-like mRNA interferase family)